MNDTTLTRPSHHQENRGVYDSAHRSEALKTRLRNSEASLSPLLTSVDLASSKISELLNQIRLTSQSRS